MPCITGAQFLNGSYSDLLNNLTNFFMLLNNTTYTV